MNIRYLVRFMCVLNTQDYSYYSLSLQLFHPLYTIIATASEDATVKLYDYESSELERTFKGHTGAVNDICFR